MTEEAAKARSESADGKYEQFAEMNDTIAEELRNLINSTSMEGKLHSKRFSSTVKQAHCH